MESSPKRLELTEAQALFFRARRGHLAGPGATDAATCAHDLLGAQSQQEASGLLAVAMRTAGRPTASDLKEDLFGPERTLVRTWGQRDTIHIYPADETWPLIVAARRLWAPQGRRGALPAARDEQKALKLVRRQPVLFREDFVSCVRDSYLDDLDDRIGDRAAKIKFACGRFAWRLSLEGHLCHAHKQGARQAYAAREHWHPQLDWPDPPIDPVDACAELTRRYLAMAAPATVQDVAHYFGARVGDARAWIARLDESGELIRVRCAGRDDLLALARDEAALREMAPRSATAWPVRILPLWDTLLMNHADKSWTVPDPAVRTLIWRKAAMVSAVILKRGRVAGTWTMKKRGKRVDFTLNALADVKRSTLEKAVNTETNTVAAHLGLEPGRRQWA